MATAPTLLVQKHLWRLLPSPSTGTSRLLWPWKGLRPWGSRCGSGLLQSGVEENGWKERALRSTRARRPELSEGLPAAASPCLCLWPRVAFWYGKPTVPCARCPSLLSPAPACSWPPSTHPAPNGDCACTTSAFTPCHRGNHGALLGDQHYLNIQAEPGHNRSGESRTQQFLTWRKEGGLGLLQRGWEVGPSLGMEQAVAVAPTSSYQPHYAVLLRSPRTAPLGASHLLAWLPLSPLEERRVSREIPFEAGICPSGSSGPSLCPSRSKSAASFWPVLAHRFAPDGFLQTG